MRFLIVRCSTFSITDFVLRFSCSFTWKRFHVHLGQRIKDQRTKSSFTFVFDKARTTMTSFISSALLCLLSVTFAYGAPVFVDHQRAAYGAAGAGAGADYAAGAYPYALNAGVHQYAHDAGYAAGAYPYAAGAGYAAGAYPYAAGAGYASPYAHGAGYASRFAQGAGYASPYATGAGYASPYAQQGLQAGAAAAQA